MVKKPLNSAGHTGDAGSTPGSGSPPGGGNGDLTRGFLPGKSHEQRSLAGYSPWGRTEPDTTRRLTLALSSR